MSKPPLAAPPPLFPMPPGRSGRRGMSIGVVIRIQCALPAQSFKPRNFPLTPLQRGQRFERLRAKSTLDANKNPVERGRPTDGARRHWKKRRRRSGRRLGEPRGGDLRHFRQVLPQRVIFSRSRMRSAVSEHLYVPNRRTSHRTANVGGDIGKGAADFAPALEFPGSALPPSTDKHGRGTPAERR